MKLVSSILPWKRMINVTIALLLLLIIFSFYGLYTNTFYFFKADNYIFPLSTLIHFTFLYVLKFKINEGELTDPQMRNLEYALYVAFLLYVFETFKTVYTLTTYSDFSNHVIPLTFLPLGVLMLVLQIALLGVTLLSLKYRKMLVGDYKFDDMNQHIDSWE